MSDLIDRQMAIEFRVSHGLNEDGRLYVSFDEVRKYLEQLPSVQPDENMIHLQKEQAYMQGWEHGREALRNMPSAQPEIIRCKDCKWYGRVDKRRFYRGMDCLQKRIDTIVPDKDFCSRAERRTDG